MTEPATSSEAPSHQMPEMVRFEATFLRLRTGSLTRQMLPEYDSAQDGSEHKIGARVNDADADGAAGECEGLGEEAPHDGVEGEVHQEEGLCRNS